MEPKSIMDIFWFTILKVYMIFLQQFIENFRGKIYLMHYFNIYLGLTIR